MSSELVVARMNQTQVSYDLPGFTREIGERIGREVSQVLNLSRARRLSDRSERLLMHAVVESEIAPALPNQPGRFWTVNAAAAAVAARIVMPPVPDYWLPDYDAIMANRKKGQSAVSGTIHRLVRSGLLVRESPGSVNREAIYKITLK